MPCFFKSCSTPPRSSELVEETTLAPGGVVVVRPVRPSQDGTDGLVFAASAGSSLISAMSLYWQVLASLSPFDCMVTQEEYAIVPGFEAPVTSTGVPTGSVPAEQPLVSVLPPVPAQCAAWPR